MAEARYLISDAAKKVDVESHVLRYWEDELELDIPRNDMGHRYYTDYHIRLFCQIRDLKDRGYQLKAIKNALNKIAEAMDDITITEELMEEDMRTAWKESRGKKEMTKDGGRDRQYDRLNRQEDGSQQQGGQGIQDDEEEWSDEPEEDGTIQIEEEKELLPAPGGDMDLQTAEEKMARFQEIMNHIIGQAVENNMSRISQEITEEVSDAVSENVTDRVMKEVEYLLRISDEKEEERFKQLDETIRAYQNKGKGRAEAAATKVPFFRKKRFGKSGKKLF